MKQKFREDEQDEQEQQKDVKDVYTDNYKILLR